VGTGEGGGGGLRPCGIGGEPAGEGEDWGFFFFCCGRRTCAGFFSKARCAAGKLGFFMRGTHSSSANIVGKNLKALSA
jgi:hypothetical protein